MDDSPRLLRIAKLTDLPAIRDIYNHYVATSTCTFQIDPETESERLAWFTERAESHPVVVCERGGTVVGWAALSPWKSRCGYAHSVEASVYVRHDLQGQGIGKDLLRDLIERARTIGHHALIGGACSEHPMSLALQKSLGFEEVAHFREVGYKFGRWLDVVYMQLIFGRASIK